MIGWIELTVGIIILAKGVFFIEVIPMFREFADSANFCLWILYSSTVKIYHARGIIKLKDWSL